MQTIKITPENLKSLLVMTTVVEARDPYTAGHMWRVSQYARRLADRAGLNADEIFVTSLGALIHDLGKVGVPDAILKKKGKLTPEEAEIMHQHPGLGKALVQDHPLGFLVADIIAEHHERIDGVGYPVGCPGEEISLYAQIVAISDSFDAMTSVRPYHREMSLPEALARILRGSGTQFNGTFVDHFVELGESGKLNHIIGHSSEDRLLVSCPNCGPIVAIPDYAQSGDAVPCPACHSHLVLHENDESFEVEWDGSFDRSLAPAPDMKLVEDFLKHAPRAVKTPKKDLD